LTDGEGNTIGTGFDQGQEGAGTQEDGGEHTAEKTRETSTTGASHGLIHHHEQCWAQRSDCWRFRLGQTNRRCTCPSGQGTTCGRQKAGTDWLIDVPAGRSPLWRLAAGSTQR
jgi:hypothetical protein